MNPPPDNSARRQRGFSLVELMIALVIGLILTAAVGYVFISSRQAFRSNEGMARLQENTRSAVLMVNTVIRMAGYLPDPLNYIDPTTVFVDPQLAVFGGAASGLSAKYGLTPTITTGGDYIEVSYVGSGDSSGNADGYTKDCIGGSVSNLQRATNLFFISKSTHDSVPSLYCAVAKTTFPGNPPAALTFGTPQPLVYGVTKLTITYGVDSDGDQAVDYYTTASYLGAANSGKWKTIKSVQLVLTTESPDTITAADATVGSPDYAVSTSSGARLQRQLTQTVELRNRLIP